MNVATAVQQFIVLDRQQSISFALAVLGAMGAGLFSFLTWAVKLAIRYELQQRIEEAKRRHGQELFNERVIVAFAQIGVVLRPPNYEGD